MILGIDPGATGALAHFDPYHWEGPKLTVHDMPVYEIKVGKTMRKRVDLTALAALIGALRENVTSMAVIEEVGPMPEDGPVQAFNLGFCAAAVQACVVSRGIPMTLVRPQTWKPKFGLTSDKDGARRVVRQMLPAYAHLFDRVKDHNRAEATLLALYGSKFA